MEQSRGAESGAPCCRIIPAANPGSSFHGIPGEGMRSLPSRRVPSAEDSSWSADDRITQETRVRGTPVVAGSPREQVPEVLNCSTWNKSRFNSLLNSQAGGESAGEYEKSRNSFSLSSRRHFLLFSNQQVPLQRFRYQDRFSPFPLLRFLRLFEVASADPKDYLTRINPT